MTNRRTSDRPGIYAIRVKGNLDAMWADWFDGMTLTPQKGGETLLIGQVADQAALHGMLAKIRDLGLPLLYVAQINSPAAGESP